MSVDNCKMIKLPRFSDQRGSLSFIEGGEHIPFSFKRFFFIYDVPVGGIRGAHAHITLFQFFLCLSGSFDIKVTDGKKDRNFSMKEPWKGLLVPPKIWTEIGNFGPKSVCGVLASDKYEESDYIRDYDHFLKEVKNL